MSRPGVAPYMLNELRNRAQTAGGGDVAICEGIAERIPWFYLPVPTFVIHVTNSHDSYARQSYRGCAKLHWVHQTMGTSSLSLTPICLKCSIFCNAALLAVLQRSLRCLQEFSCRRLCLA